ncbi:hypothetical protein NDU88_002345 [Pleurodeles waltl]|uniref:Uncharacterized protein n=1 Tax=Pleurodeles waltl TaxID=8319 RepID=A0AAV7RFB6_PLEWA|nr:hypothetical protein NDU88_002345 [Pleurodeles waltl]
MPHPDTHISSAEAAPVAGNLHYLDKGKCLHISNGSNNDYHRNNKVANCSHVAFPFSVALTKESIDLKASGDKKGARANKRNSMWHSPPLTCYSSASRPSSDLAAGPGKADCGFSASMDLSSNKPTLTTIIQLMELLRIEARQHFAAVRSDNVPLQSVADMI